LKIRDESAIGEIHACPRCGGMVQIARPKDRPAEEGKSAAGSMTAKVSASTAKSPANDNPLKEISADEIARLAEVSNAPAVEPVSGSTTPWYRDARVAWVCVPVSAAAAAIVVWLMTRTAKPIDPVVAQATVTQAPVESSGINPAAATNDPVTPAVAVGSGLNEVTPPATPTPAVITPPAALPPVANSTPPATTPPAAPPSTSPPAAVPVPQAPPTIATSKGPVGPSTLMESRPLLNLPSTANPGNVTPVTVTPGNVPPATVTPVTVPPQPAPPPANPPAVATSNPPTAQPPVNMPPPINITAKLADELASVDFPRATLYDFLQLVSGMTAIPITLDHGAMAQRNVRLDTPLSVKKFNLSYGELLQGVLAEQGLRYVVQDRQLLITSGAAEDAKLPEVKYAAADFEPDTPAQIADLIKLVIEPSTWTDSGGPGTIRVDGNNLIVQQSPTLQRAVADLLAKLRAARGKTPAESLAKHRCHAADEKLATLVRVNFVTPTPLAEVLKYLHKSSGMFIVIDHGSLAVAGMTAQLPVSLVAQDVPLGKALDSMLAPHGLVLRVIDSTTVEVTTRLGAERQPDIELYPLGKLAVERAVEDVKRQLAAAPEPSQKPLGTFNVDPLSRHLIVSQSQATQRQVEQWLARINVQE